MPEPILAGFTVTLTWPGSLAESVAARRSEPFDTSMVNFIAEMASLLVPDWPAGREPIARSEVQSRGDSGEYCTSGTYRVGTEQRHIAVSFSHIVPEEMVYPLPHSEYRRFTVVGLPPGHQLVVQFDRETLNGGVRPARLQLYAELPESSEGRVSAAFRFAFADLEAPDEGEAKRP